MKTFEEKWTAWVDGELNDAERAAFEASLEDRAAAEAEKNQAHKLGAAQGKLQPRVGNEEFFIIGCDSHCRGKDRRDGLCALRESWWTIRRCFGRGLRRSRSCRHVFVMRQEQAPDQSQYLTQILNARVTGRRPKSTVSIFLMK